MFGNLLKTLFKKPDYTAEQQYGLGYKTNGTSSREKPGNGKQKMLLDSTKLLLDNHIDTSNNPYEAECRIDNNVYQMFADDAKVKKNR